MKIVLRMVSLIFLCSIAVAAVARVSKSQFARTANQDQIGRPAEHQAQAKIQTFVGTIAKTGNEFVFSDDAAKHVYELDDQQTASRFDGKKVRVTGVLDAANMIIRVQSIETAV